MSTGTRVLRGLAVVAALLLIPVSGVAHAADAVAPGAITHLQTFTHVGAVTFSWDLPADTDLTKTLIQARIGTAPPSSPTDPAGILSSDPVSCAPAEAAVHVCSPGDVTWIDGLDPGTDFTFGFWEVDSSGNVGPVVTKTLVATDLTLRSSVSTVTYGGGTTFTAQLRRTGSGGGVGGVKVDFYVRQHGTRSWYFWYEGTTNGSGVVAPTFRPGVGLDVQAYFYGEGDFLGTAVSGTTVGVRAKVGASVNFSSRKKGKSFTIRGVVASKDPVTTAWIERYAKGSWKRVKTVKVTGLKTTSGTRSGNVKYTVKPKKKGKYTYRVTSPGSSKYEVSHSRSLKFTVT